MSRPVQTPSEEELSRDILNYMLENPDALDEAEGILMWWISEERLRIGKAAIRVTLEKLVARGMIVARIASGGRTVYSLNKERRDEIVHFVKKKTG